VTGHENQLGKAGVTRHRVRVDVATVWSSPQAPRPIDAPAVADDPDSAAWADALDRDARLGLHGRTETQVLRAEPVDVTGAGPDGWVHIVAPWQPSPKDRRGYPGWVRQAHLAPDDKLFAVTGPPAHIDLDPESILRYARGYLGSEYLWGGMSRDGIDCSGLVHRAFRAAGIVIPRDADAQHAALQPVALGDEQPGDLYFFGRPGVTHVGLVIDRLRMLHAPQAGALVEEATVAGERLTSLVAAGRVVSGGSF
jgi:gamma-D-glutamyl-L-lysine dipeptidyl-peptidase